MLVGAFVLSRCLIFVFTIIVVHLFPAASPSSAQDSSEPAGQQAGIPEIQVEKTESMVDVGGRKLHCTVYGQGSPAVVLISGLNAPQACWNPIIPPLCETATIVTYDRAGYGKSEVGGLPLHGQQSAEDLNVAGLILEDTQHEDILEEPWLRPHRGKAIRASRLGGG